MTDGPGNGWQRHEQVVLYRLDELKKAQEETTAQLSNVRTDIAMLKIKSGLWGATAGLIPVVILITVTLLTQGGS